MFRSLRSLGFEVSQHFVLERIFQSSGWAPAAQDCMWVWLRHSSGFRSLRSLEFRVRGGRLRRRTAGGQLRMMNDE